MFGAFLIAAATFAATLTGPLTATSAQGALADPCWSTFNPPAPQGGSLEIRYKNCNSLTANVSWGTTDAGGQVELTRNNCRNVPPANSTSWSLASTELNRNYHVMLCRPNAPVQVTPSLAGYPCWTSFVPTAPNGGPMVQQYRNCNSVRLAVAPAYVDGSGQYTVLVDKCVGVAAGESARWQFSETNIGVNYSTAICSRL